MPPPTYPWTVIAAGQTDQDSPVDQTLMDGIRENLIHLEEWLGDGYIAAKNHDHGGVNSSIMANGAVTTTAKLANAIVSQAKLKTSIGSVNTSSTTGADLTLPGGEYGFYPQIKNEFGGENAYWGTTNGTFHTAHTTSDTYLSRIILYTTNALRDAYAQQRYVTASGEIFWIFILRDKITKKVNAMYQAPDHPCFGNGNDPDKVPHPFPSFDPMNQEIVVIQGPQDDEGRYPQFIQDIKTKAKDTGKDPLEIIKAEYEIDEASAPVWSNKPITVGLDDEDVYAGKEVKIIKKSIPKRPELTHKNLKLKGA